LEIDFVRLFRRVVLKKSTSLLASPYRQNIARVLKRSFTMAATPQQKIPISVDEAYASEPWWYDARGFLILTFAYRSTLPQQIRFFAGNISAQHLEAAIGSGTLFDLILKYRRWKKMPPVKIVGFDYAPQMLAGAKKRFEKRPEIQLIQADAAHLSFPNNSFDSINIANAFHCLPEPEVSLKEMHRVLKAGGKLAGNCLLYPRENGLGGRLANRINRWGQRKGILNRPYTCLEIQQMLRIAGFQIVYENIVGNCYDFIAVKN
jgi:SAM-dependent methyltransferase